MAFPQVVSTAASGSGSGTTTFNATMPTSISAGNLLIAQYFSGFNNRDWPDDARWTILEELAWNSTSRRSWIVCRVATGDANDALSIDRTGLSDVISCIIFNISGWGGDLTPVGTKNLTDVVSDRVSATTSNPNPPSLTSGFGAVDTLWIVTCATAILGREITAYPSNYTSNQVLAYGVSSYNALAGATYELNAATEDPGTFTVSDSAASSLANTIAVRPASGASAVAGISRHYARMMTG